MIEKINEGHLSTDSLKRSEYLIIRAQNGIEEITRMPLVGKTILIEVQ